MTEKYRSARRKSHPSVKFYTINPTQNGLGKHLRLRREGSAANDLGHGMVQTHQDFLTVFYKMSSLLTNLSIRPIYRKFVEGIFISQYGMTVRQKSCCNKIFKKKRGSKIYLVLSHKLWFKRGCRRSPASLNFVQWYIMFVCSQNGNCLFSAYRRLQFLGNS
jgi:hypothetical protein